MTKANRGILTDLKNIYLYYANVHNYLLRAKQENYFQMPFIFIFGVIPTGPHSTCIQIQREVVGPGAPGGLGAGHLSPSQTARNFKTLKIQHESK